MISAPAISIRRRSEGELIDRIRSAGPALVALSGGVDSAVVASLAFRALGPRALAVTLTGPAVSAAEVARAARVVSAIGIPHETIPVDPLAVREYRANPANRCFFCRTTETRALVEFGGPRGVLQYLDGVHMDDLGDDRPGLRAMDAAGFRHPLLEAGWHKRDAREYAQAIRLPNWDEPSDACLASRIPHGQEVTREMLDRVSRSEAVVRALGFRRVRVRVHGSSARVEVDPVEVSRLMESGISGRVRSALTEIGFDHVDLDPTGYRPRTGG